MANDLNSCEFIGRLGADPEIRYMPNGNPVANIRIACGKSWKNKDTGQKEERTEWIPVVFFGKIAEVVGQYLAKGSRIFVRGEFRTRKWQNKEGQDVYTTEVVVDINGQMQMLDSKGGEKQPAPEGQQKKTTTGQGYQQPGGGSMPEPIDDFDDDIPFNQQAA